MQIFDGQEQSVFIAGPAGQLEARVQAGDAAGVLASSRAAVVIGHPHPQHGGTMTNKVVATLARGYQQLGVATVRFNFRGVGASAGQYDQGRGERDDMVAVARWLVDQWPEAQLLLAGFSFGSAMAAAACWQLSPAHLALIAPPVERYAYDREGRFPCPVAVLIGAADELVDVAGVEHWVRGLVSPCAFASLPDTGHFFHGQLHALKQWLQRELPVQLATQ